MSKIIPAVLLFTAFLFADELENLERAFVTGRTLSAEDAASREAALLSDPENASARAELLGYYGTGATPDVRANRLRHIAWIIEHHPESSIARLQGATANPRGNVGEYQQVQELWLKAVDRYPHDARVL